MPTAMPEQVPLDDGAGPDAAGGDLVPAARTGPVSFAIWLIVAMTAGLLLTTVVDYALTSRQLEAQLLADLTATTRTQADLLSTSAGSNRTARLASLLADDVVSVAVLDPSGTTLQQAEGPQAEGPHQAPQAGGQAGGPPAVDAAAVRSVAQTGLAQTRQAGGWVVTYLRLSGAPPQVLRVVRTAGVIERRLVELKRSALPIFLLGIPLGMLVFYLAGGRRLAGRYRSAVDGSGLDVLTGLGNRQAMRSQLADCSLDALRTGAPFALVLLDVDHFGQINDVHGHRYGDEVLIDLTAAINQLPPPCWAFRIGGDEFALVILGADVDSATALADTVRQALGTAHPGCTLSCGIALFDPQSPDIGELLDRADAALFAAKRGGRDQVAVLRDTQAPWSDLGRARRRLADLLQNGSVSTVYQPIWDLEHNRVLAYEALTRLAPESGFGNPQELFLAAERLRLTKPLDELCMQTALAAAAQLPEGARLFLNMCPHTLADPEFEPADVAEKIRAAGLPPELVVIEITENGRVDWLAMRHRLEGLRAAGIAVALDDVGSGDTGLQVMRKVDTDFLKIDREIIVDAIDSGTARAVLAAILAYAVETGSYVIAEGIENQQMLELVRQAPLNLGRAQVHGVQGYLLGRPAPSFLNPREREGALATMRP